MALALAGCSTGPKGGTSADATVRAKTVRLPEGFPSSSPPPAARLSCVPAGAILYGAVDAEVLRGIFPGVPKGLSGLSPVAWRGGSALVFESDPGWKPCAPPTQKAPFEHLNFGREGAAWLDFEALRKHLRSLGQVSQRAELKRALERGDPAEIRAVRAELGNKAEEDLVAEAIDRFFDRVVGDTVGAAIGFQRAGSALQVQLDAKLDPRALLALFKGPMKAIPRGLYQPAAVSLAAQVDPIGALELVRECLLVLGQAPAYRALTGLLEALGYKTGVEGALQGGFFGLLVVDDKGPRAPARGALRMTTPKRPRDLLRRLTRGYPDWKAGSGSLDGQLEDGRPVAIRTSAQSFTLATQPELLEVEAAPAPAFAPLDRPAGTLMMFEGARIATLLAPQPEPAPQPTPAPPALGAAVAEAHAQQTRAIQALASAMAAHDRARAEHARQRWARLGRLGLRLHVQGDRLLVQAVRIGGGPLPLAPPPSPPETLDGLRRTVTETTARLAQLRRKAVRAQD